MWVISYLDLKQQNVVTTDLENVSVRGVDWKECVHCSELHICFWRGIISDFDMWSKRIQVNNNMDLTLVSGGELMQTN